MAPCTPALNFAANGNAGSAFPAPLDPSDVPHIEQEPTFEHTACSLLGADLCSSMDEISSIDELGALVDSIDTLSTAADAALDTVLLELDQLGQDQVGHTFDAFSAAQPGAENLLGGVATIAAPAMVPVPLVTPDNVVQISPGAPPEYGGIATAGGPGYVLHQVAAHGWVGQPAPEFVGFEGPNPPFAGFAGFAVEPTPDGLHRSYLLLNINPTQAGTFTAQVGYRVAFTIAGNTGTLRVVQPVTVIVQ